MSKALIIIDIQNDYFEGGKMELHNPLKASENAKKLLHKFREESKPVVHVQHIAPDAEAGFFIPDTEGIAIHPNVRPEKGEKIVTKHYPNAFRDTDLLDHLKSNDISELIFAGMMTQMCIDSSVRAARDFGFECTVIGDACATRDIEINGKTVKAADVQNAFLGGLSFFYAENTNTTDYLSDN